MLSPIPTDPTAARIALDRARYLARIARLLGRNDRDRVALRRGAREWAHDARLHSTGACQRLSCRRIDESFRTFTGGY